MNRNLTIGFVAGAVLILAIIFLNSLGDSGTADTSAPASELSDANGEPTQNA